MDNIKQPRIRRAVEELYYWQRAEDASNFTSILYTLISKADIVNKVKLSNAFPAEWIAFDLWKNSFDEDAFFKEWLGDGIMRKRAR